MSKKNTNPPELKKSIGLKLKQARLDQGLSQTELGDLLGITHAAVGSYERGRLSISLQFLIKISQILQKPIYYFIEENEEAKQIYEAEQELKQKKYDLNDNVLFALELAIKSYLRAKGAKVDLEKKINQIIRFINKVLQR